MVVTVDGTAGEVGEIYAKVKEEAKDLVTSFNVMDFASKNVGTK
jgi:hypothetical protein